MRLDVLFSRSTSSNEEETYHAVVLLKIQNSEAELLPPVL